MEGTIRESNPISNLYANGAGIENKLAASSLVNPLERQVIQMPLYAEEAEDPPETLHTTWGIWLHKWDALHAIDQKYDTEHVLRTTRAADDILHYYHYVPVIGEHEHIIESYEMGFEYDYSNEEILYNASVKLDEESDEETEIVHDTEPFEEPNLTDQGNDEEPDMEEKTPMGKEQKTADFNKESLKMSEEILKLIKIKIG